MVGRHHLEIENKKVRYVFDIDRKVTVIKGNSGTGKTTLIRMLQGYISQGNKSGISVKNNTSIPLAVFDMMTRWEQELEEQGSKIIFIDEAVDYIYSKAFQEEFTVSNHYLVVISRSGRFNHLPYAINSIYEFRTEKLNEKTKLTRLYRMYEYDAAKAYADIIVTEDSSDISKYLTWEQYYTDLLQSLCREEFGFSYVKSQLHKSFLNENSKRQVKEELLRSCVMAQ